MSTTETEASSPKVKDLTHSVHATDAGEHETDPVYIKTRRLALRVGTVFFALCGLALFLPVLLGVGQGIMRGQMWDPYTGNPVEKGTPRVQCMDDAQRLMLDASNHQKLVPAWTEPYRDWISVCRKDHPELYELLLRTREQLLKKQLPETNSTGKP